MIAYQQRFHSRVVVADLESAMATFGEAFDLQHRQSPLLRELVSTQLRPAFEAWWAGGTLD